MYLLLAIVLALFGYAINGDNKLGDTPFATLTLNMLFSSALAVGAYACALWALFRSWDHDRIWPWHWSLPFLGNSVIRICVVAGLWWVGLYFITKQHLDGFLLLVACAVLAVCSLYVLFTSELDYFAEKNLRWIKKKAGPDHSPLRVVLDSNVARSTSKLVRPAEDERTPK